MKIRSVQLTHFRKFVGTFVVDGIGDSVNVLVGHNELGKSTLLAAINGVIFEKAKSQTETVKSFRHAVTGNVPEVELVFDLDDTSWTIRKRFALQSGKAWLTNSKGDRYEDEVAETQLQKLFEIGSRRGGSESGIWGTLWVSQGQSFGDPSLNDVGRNTLQGCIETQVGVVTGGERGRKLPLAVDQALREIMSSKGPSGRYKDALALLEEASDRAAQLDEKRQEIFQHMDSLTRQKQERRNLLLDWNDEEHQNELEAARTLRIAASIQALKIEAARKEATNAEERAARERKTVETRAELVREIESIEAGIRDLAMEASQAQTAVEGAKFKVDACESTLADIREKLRLNNEEIRKFERLRSAVGLQTEIDRHTATLEKATTLQETLGQLSEQIGQITATDDSISRIETAETDLAGAKATLNAVATNVLIAVESDAMARITLDNVPLSAQTVSRSIVAKTEIQIQGVGTISIEPKIENRDTMLTRLKAAENERLSALEGAGAENLSAARLAVAQRKELERRIAEVRREIAGLAPKEAPTKLAAGLEARQTRIHELQGRLNAELKALHLQELPTSEEIEKKISEIHRNGEILEADLSVTDSEAIGHRDLLEQSAVTLRKFEKRLAVLEGNLETQQASLKASCMESSDEKLAANVLELTRLAEEARATQKHIEGTLGETVEAIDARIKRLESAGRNHREKLNGVNSEIMRLTTLIEANEGAGVEEALEIARADQARLDASVKGYEEESLVLQILQTTLRDAESEAKTLYLAPVVSRIEPYLRMLLPGADLVLDENLGISAIKRNGTDEAFDRLSDGTQEQLAILTRLAFAELLLAKGRPATVILDDAMAFSDDDRIEHMFDILMRAGDRVQILVLTCRKKLFSRLGATELTLKEIPT